MQIHSLLVYPQKFCMMYMYHVCCRVCRHGSYDNVHDLGSLQADLIHLGARYSPCMRADENVIAAIEQDRDAERRSACCVRNDGSGCHQTTLATCSVRSRPLSLRHQNQVLSISIRVFCVIHVLIPHWNVTLQP